MTTCERDIVDDEAIQSYRPTKSPNALSIQTFDPQTA